MNRVLAVFRKEVLDNFRDKRTLFFAFLYGPLLLPLLMVGPIAIGISKHSIDFDKSLTVYITNMDRAPNLMQFLREENLVPTSIGDSFKTDITAGEAATVLDIPESYGKKIRTGETVTLNLYFDSENDESHKAMRQLQAVLHKYGQQLAALRMHARGIDNRLITPIRVMDEDLNKGDEREKLIARLLPFILVFSLTMGGFYLAIDSTAGERERFSLEPLLSLSISRFELVFGKFLAISLFVFCSGLLAVTATFCLFTFLPVEELRQLVDVSVVAFGKIFLLCLPLVFFFASAMLALASLAKNTKEAQTHLSLAMMLPMAPFFVIQFMNIKTVSILFWVPVMSQFLLVEKLFVSSGVGVNLVDVFASAAGTLGAALLTFMVSVRQYSNEKILSGA